MFEAQDTPECLMKVWFTTYHDQLSEMQDPGFKMSDGRSVIVLFGGDYHFQDDNTGHQGSSAMYPSGSDLVHREHLKHHPKTPHTPEHCPCEIRTVEGYIGNYNANVQDDRANGDMRLNGKEHFSVVGTMIFPLRSLDQVVPPSLHITLGVTLLLYNLLLKECQAVDEEAGAVAQQAKEKSAIDQEWVLASQEMTKFEEQLKDVAKCILMMMNRKARCEAVMKGNHTSNESLAENSVATRKSGSSKGKYRKKESPSHCASSLCIVTAHDSDIEWVQCDTCTENDPEPDSWSGPSWYHTMCEGLTQEEETKLSKTSYTCIKCRVDAATRDPNFVREEIVKCFDSKISVLINEEEFLQKQIIDLQVICDDLKSSYHKYTGQREKRLNEELEKMHVHRQAYHGNVFVGNHAIIVLENHRSLTKVIEDQAGYDALNKIFDNFNGIVKLMMARRFLTPEEIENLKSLIHEFGVQFPSFGRSITRKIHELIFTVPRFVTKYKTIGLLSEQEAESKHASVNAELRSLACVRNHAEKLKLVLQREELRSCMNKSLMKPVPRLCSVCPRTFLRSAPVDGSRHCPKCESDLFSN